MGMFEYINHLYWREPLWLLVSLQPLVIYLLKIFFTKNSASRYADKKLQPWIIIPSHFKLKNKLLSKNTFYLAGWILFSIALAGPRTIINQPDKPQLNSTNIMLIVDASLSMHAMDIVPSRIRRARIEISEFLSKAAQHRVGIIVYAARPHLYVPLTSDLPALKSYLDSLDKLEFPTSGSDPLAAILLAKKELEKQKGKSAIVLLSDGDTASFSDINQFSALDKLKQSKIPLYILGLGSVEGEAIPLENGSWLNYNNKPVISRMNQALLQRLAIKYNGAYSPVQDDDSDWDLMFEHGLLRNATITTPVKDNQVIWHELYHYFLLSALLCFIVALAPVRLVNPKYSAVVFILTLSLSVLPGKEAKALNLFSTPEQQAYHAYNNRHYDEALQYYKNINGYRGLMGTASSLYKLGHYKEAVAQFSLAIINATTDTQRAAALYNLANSYVHTGNFSAAITTYQDVLRYQPAHHASISNLALSQQLYETLQKQINKQAQNIRPRQGRGPRSASIDEGAEIESNTSVSLGDSKKQEPKDQELPEIPGTSRETLKKLLQLGLNHVHLAQQESKNPSAAEQRSSQDVMTAQIYLQQVTTFQPALWKRLFEMEEGFPAPVEQPKVIPGVNPW